jgi:hypothetical protein
MGDIGDMRVSFADPIPRSPIAPIMGDITGPKGQRRSLRSTVPVTPSREELHMTERDISISK